MGASFNRPLPAIIPFSGLTDANGKLTINLPPLRQAFWWTGKLVGKVAGGGAVWEFKHGGFLGGSGSGPRAEISGLLVAPGETAEIDITGASPTSVVTGTLRGVQGPRLEDIVDHFTASPNTVTVVAQASNTAFPVITAAAGATVSATLVPPAGTLSIEVIIDRPDLLDFTNTSLSGFTTGNLYSTTGPQAATTVFNSRQKLYRIVVQLAQDAKYSFQMRNTGGPPSVNAWLTAITDPSTAALAAETPNVLPSQIPQSHTNLAATSVNSGAALTVVAGTANQTLYPRHYSFSQDTANTASQWQLQDTNNNGFATFLDAAVRHVFASGDFGGTEDLAVGIGLQIVNNGAAASFVSGVVTYTKQ